MVVTLPSASSRTGTSWRTALATSTGTDALGAAPRRLRGGVLRRWEVPQSHGNARKGEHTRHPDNQRPSLHGALSARTSVWVPHSLFLLRRGHCPHIYRNH